jgi:hypothetical protein
VRVRFRYLAAAGAVVAVLAAPTAAADDNNQSCTDVANTTECSSPGNVQINAAPPVVEEPFTLPYWDEAYGGGGAYPGPYPVPYAEG